MADERYYLEYNDNGECLGVLDRKTSILYLSSNQLVDLLNEKEAEINRLEYIIQADIIEARNTGKYERQTIKEVLDNDGGTG